MQLEGQPARLRPYIKKQGGFSNYNQTVMTVNPKM